MSDSMNAIDVAYQTEVSLESKSTEELTAETNTYYRQAESLAAMSATMLAEAGRRLIEVKSRIPHGDFTDWCEKNLEFSYRKAARMMQLAEKMDDDNSLFSKMPTLATIGISRVWALLAAPEEVAEEVVENNDVESMKVRELQEELARVKAEKETAEHKAAALDDDNDKIRKDLASLQGKLSESVSVAEFAQMQEAAQAQKDDLNNELNEAKTAAADIQAKLDKAKEDLKKQKAKLKAAEEGKDEEIRKAVAEALPDLEKKAKEEGAADAAAALAQNAEDIAALQAEIERLETEKAKLSNTSLMEFKVLCDQLQDIVGKIKILIGKTRDDDDSLAAKMEGALTQLIAGMEK